MRLCVFFYSWSCGKVRICKKQLLFFALNLLFSITSAVLPREHQMPQFFVIYIHTCRYAPLCSWFISPGFSVVLGEETTTIFLWKNPSEAIENNVTLSISIFHSQQRNAVNVFLELLHEWWKPNQTKPQPTNKNKKKNNSTKTKYTKKCK